MLHFSEVVCVWTGKVAGESERERELKRDQSPPPTLTSNGPKRSEIGGFKQLLSQRDDKSLRLIIKPLLL